MVMLIDGVVIHRFLDFVFDPHFFTFCEV